MRQDCHIIMNGNVIAGIEVVRRSPILRPSQPKVSILLRSRWQLCYELLQLGGDASTAAG
eukprot:6489451-Amphidinium_carterae.1